MTHNADLTELLTKARTAENRQEYKKALKYYDMLLQNEPENATHYNAVAVVLYKMQRYKDAKKYFELALKYKPDYAEALSNLGALHAKFKNYAKAIKLYERAIKIKPSYAGAYTNLGNALNKIHEYEEAIHFHRLAIKIDPNAPNHYANCASAYKNLGRFDKAEALYREAIRLEPHHVNAHFDLSTVLLQTGDFEAGWNEYEWRFNKEEMSGHLHNFKNIFKAPRYHKQNLKAKTLLLHSEQGFGDSLMVIRYAKTLQQRGATVIAYVREGLESLFKEIEGIDLVQTRGDTPKAFDYQLPMMSLPLVCDAKLEQIQDHYPYIRSKKSDIKLPESKKKYKIGLVWGASNTGESYEKKVLDLKGMLPFFSLPNIQFYSLQMGEDVLDIKKLDLQEKLIDLSPLISDFSDTAALIDQLDLVISADTSVAHLCGGMGKELWVLLQKVPDWRWGVDGESNIWYPSAKVFRQYSLGDWKQLYGRVFKALKNRCL